MNHVSYEQRGPIAVLRMDDGKANALNPELLEGLERGLDRAEKEAKAVVLAGRPGRFSAGFDLKIMGQGPAAIRALVLQGGQLMMRLYGHPLPIVGACSGHAIAGGLLLLASTDARIGIEGPFKFGLNEVANGMPVPILAHELARDRLDRRQLCASVMTSKMYSPEDALSAGWLDSLVAPEQLEAAALATAEQMAQLPAKAFGMTKLSLRKKTINHVLATIEEDLDAFTSL